VRGPLQTAPEAPCQRQLAAAHASITTPESTLCIIANRGYDDVKDRVTFRLRLGLALRRVRSPEAPKMTMVHGSGVRASRRPWRRGISAVTGAATCFLLRSLHNAAAGRVAQGGDDPGPGVLFRALRGHGPSSPGAWR